MTKNSTVKNIPTADGNLGKLDINDVQLETRAAEGIPALYDPTASLTAKLIEERIGGAMELLHLAFNEPEVRFEADNGRFYRADRPMPGDAHLLDQPGKTFNRWEWKANNVLSAIVNKFERSCNDEDERIVKQQGVVRSTMRQVQTGRKSDANLDYEVNKLEAMIEQNALTIAAFRASFKTYDELTGEQYETQAMRQERIRLETRAPSAGIGANAVDDRVKALLAPRS